MQSFLSDNSDSSKIYRFGVLENRPHSTGPVYITVADLPRDHRFLQVNVICPLITPGPNEPNYDQITHVLEPVAKEITILKNGTFRDRFVGQWLTMSIQRRHNGNI